MGIKTEQNRGLAETFKFVEFGQNKIIFLSQFSLLMKYKTI